MFGKCSWCRKEIFGSFRSQFGTTICGDCIKEIGEGYLEGLNKWIITEYSFRRIFRIEPVFTKRKFEVDRKKFFFLCPFTEPFNSIYTNHILPVIAELGFVLQRADEIYSVQPVIEDIWEGICSSSTIIGDVTGRNPNVMYEIGIAHTLGKPVVILTQDINDVPFDLRHYRCIVYEYTPLGIKTLEDHLKKTINNLWPELISETDKK